MLKRLPRLRAACRPSQPPLGGCVLKLTGYIEQAQPVAPAAFRRLCVETTTTGKNWRPRFQPPLGGCVLKPSYWIRRGYTKTQPPLGGCVLKPTITIRRTKTRGQPPLGGCVLKQIEYALGEV